jgi:hypothetical protein
MNVGIDLGGGGPSTSKFQVPMDKQYLLCEECRKTSGTSIYPGYYLLYYADLLQERLLLSSDLWGT